MQGRAGDHSKNESFLRQQLQFRDFSQDAAGAVPKDFTQQFLKVPAQGTSGKESEDKKHGQNSSPAGICQPESIPLP